MSDFDKMAVFPNVCSYLERFGLANQLGQNMLIKANVSDLIKASSMTSYH